MFVDDQIRVGYTVGIVSSRSDTMSVIMILYDGTAL